MMDEKTRLKTYIEILDADLWASWTTTSWPPKSLVIAANYVMATYNRDEIPDWVEALANANLDNWAAAVDEIRRMNLEEGEP